MTLRNLLSAFVCLACITSLAFAQDSPAANQPEKPVEKTAEKPADEPKTPAARFAAANSEWQALDKRFKELERTYNTSDSPTARAETKRQYEQLIAQSNKLLPELRAAAEAAYLAEPNKDPAVTRLLIGMVGYDVRRDEYETALKLAKLLEDNKCDEGVLYDVAGTAAYNSDDYIAAERYFAAADKAGKLSVENKKSQAELPEQKKAWAAEQETRNKEAQADDLPRVKLETSKGVIVVELFENEAPQTVGNFVSLVEGKKYDGLTFHRVLPGFMAQGGDPEGTGAGGPGYEIYCECYRPDYRRHFRGTLSMAHAGKDSGGSQFFLTFRPTTHLNGRHTAFGRVIEGLDVLAKLQRINPERPSGVKPDTIVKAEVLRKRDHKYEPTKVVK
ncbi:MAG: peptidylprolyl isomerase [Planctomycetaceae bacterium]|nr:peptidylprolyl isomerase [Planctomycetaceae bacterium]